MKLVLLDRDGVLNEDRPDYVKNPGELVMLPGTAKAVARLNAAGFTIAICTNQAGIAKGIFDEAMLARILALVRRGLMTFEGDLQPLMANLLYIKGVLEAPRVLAVEPGAKQ